VRIFLNFLLFLVVVLVCGCDHALPVVTVVNAATQTDPTPRVREADDAGRFIAGLPGAPGSPFANLEGARIMYDRSGRTKLELLRAADR